MKMRAPTFPSDVWNRETLDDHPFYRQMEIVAGVKPPLNWDVRDAILVDGSAGRFWQLRYFNHQSEVAAMPYLRDLFSLPHKVLVPGFLGSQRNIIEKAVYDHLRAARAKKLGLPENSSWEVVLNAERDNPRGILTMSELRRARDERNGVACSAPCNTREW